MTIEVYWGSGSPFAWSVLLGFEVKKLPYTSHLLSFSAGDLKTPEFLALNPRGKVPVVKDGDFVLGESMAILAWLDRKHPSPALFGTTAEETGAIWRACLEHANFYQPAAHEVASALFSGEIAQKRDAVMDAARKLADELDRYEAAAKGTGWLAGNALSAADLVVYPQCELLFRVAGRDDVKPLQLGFEAGWSAYPALSAWREKIKALPGYDKHLPAALEAGVKGTPLSKTAVQPHAQ